MLYYLLFVCTAIALATTEALESKKIDLSVDASLSGGSVYFVSADADAIGGLKDCKIYLNGDVVPDAKVEFLWKRFRGKFTVTVPGNYDMKCNAGHFSGSIRLLPKLFAAAQASNKVAYDQVKETVFDGTIPSDWKFVNVYLRNLDEVDRFAAFYEHGAIKRNITAEAARDFLQTIKKTHTNSQIHVEPQYEPVTPNLHREGAKVQHDVTSSKSPLLDGTMGWMKSFNFSARDRICGKGATIHFYDDGYHLTHEDLQNPNIKVRTQKPQCDDFSVICDHGTASLGILAAMKNDFGIEGLSRCADEINLYSYTYPKDDVFKFAKPGDIYGMNAQFAVGDIHEYLPMACAHPSFTNEIYKNGIILVQAAGNSRLDMNTYKGCQNQSGPAYGFVVSATVRNSDTKRDMGVSDTGIGWFTNYNHDNSIVNNWGERVITTYANSGSAYYGGRNKGYSAFSGTSSATPLTTGLFGVLQGYMRSRCPDMFLNFENFAEIFRKTGSSQQVESKMGYMPNIYAALRYIEDNFVQRCQPTEDLENFSLEERVPSYDDLFDPWQQVQSTQKAYMCSDNNVDFSSVTGGYISEETLLKWTDGKPKDLVMCQENGFWAHYAVYLPVITKETFDKLKGTTFTFVRHSTFEFRVVRTFGNEVWPLNMGQSVSFKLALDNNKNTGYGSTIENANANKKSANLRAA